jgi:nitrogen fixation-related uncharacterized protein
MKPAKKVSLRLFIASLFVMLLLIIALLYSLSSEQQYDLSGPAPKHDKEAVKEVKKFRKVLGKLININGVYYSIPGLTTFIDSFSKKILAKAFDTTLIRQVNDSTAVYLQGAKNLTLNGKNYTLKKGDSLDIVIGFYWKLKNDPTANGGNGKDQFDFVMIPTLRIRDTNPRNGVIDYIDDKVFYNHKDDTSTVVAKGGTALVGNLFDEGQMYP